jgi:hypothetical protein
MASASMRPIALEIQKAVFLMGTLPFVFIVIASASKTRLAGAAQFATKPAA